MLRQRWLWSMKHTVLDKPTLRQIKEKRTEDWEWEHMLLSYKSCSNFERKFEDVWKTFERK